MWHNEAKPDSIYFYFFLSEKLKTPTTLYKLQADTPTESKTKNLLK